MRSTITRTQTVILITLINILISLPFCKATQWDQNQIDNYRYVTSQLSTYTLQPHDVEIFRSATPMTIYHTVEVMKVLSFYGTEFNNYTLSAIMHAFSGFTCDYYEGYRDMMTKLKNHHRNDRFILTVFWDQMSRLQDRYKDHYKPFMPPEQLYRILAQDLHTVCLQYQKPPHFDYIFRPLLSSFSIFDTEKVNWLIKAALQQPDGSNSYLSVNVWEMAYILQYLSYIEPEKRVSILDLAIQYVKDVDLSPTSHLRLYNVINNIIVPASRKAIQRQQQIVSETIAIYPAQETGNIEITL